MKNSLDLMYNGFLFFNFILLSLVRFEISLIMIVFLCLVQLCYILAWIA